MMTFQLMQQERQVVLSHKADLLATLAFLRNGEAATIADVSQDPWQSEDCDLFLLADGRGKIVALHAKSVEPPVAGAEEMLRRASVGHSSKIWSVSGRHI
jgi:hypothetical protein